MIVIAALGRNRVIGSGSGMPWSVPEEYARFLGLVRGQALIMGRRSWEIFGRDLSESENFVVSRGTQPVHGARRMADLDSAIEAARATGRQVFIAGGASVYAQALPRAESLYLSYIEGEFEGDSFFPEIDPSAWKVERRELYPRFEFVVYRRRS